MQASLDSLTTQLLTQTSEAHRPQVQQALELASNAHMDQVRVSGEPYVSHVIAVANILADLRLDHETVCAALLHDVVEDTPVTLEIIRQELGGSIAAMVDGVTKLNSLDDLHVSEEALAAFMAGVASINKRDTRIPEPSFEPLEDARNLGELDAALARLAGLRPRVRRRVLAAVLACIQHDHHIELAEHELFRAIAATLGCPVPPAASIDPKSAD